MSTYHIFVVVVSEHLHVLCYFLLFVHTHVLFLVRIGEIRICSYSSIFVYIVLQKQNLNLVKFLVLLHYIWFVDLKLYPCENTCYECVYLHYT